MSQEISKHTTFNAEQVLAAVQSEATAFGRCCDCYQDGFGTFCCHDCGQKTMTMLSGVQRVLGIHSKDGSPIAPMERDDAIKAALVRRAAPDLLAALKLAVREMRAVRDGSTGGIPNDIIALLPEAIEVADAAIAKARG